MNDIDFYFFSAHEIKQRETEFIELLKSVDIVHWLMNYCNIELPDGISADNLNCPSIATIHHVTLGEEKKIEYAKFCDLIHVVSKEWLKKLRHKENLSVALAHNGVDVKKFSLASNSL